MSLQGAKLEVEGCSNAPSGGSEIARKGSSCHADWKEMKPLLEANTALSPPSLLFSLSRFATVLHFFYYYFFFISRCSSLPQLLSPTSSGVWEMELPWDWEAGPGGCFWHPTSHQGPAATLALLLLHLPQPCPQIQGWHSSLCAPSPPGSPTSLLCTSHFLADL